MNKVLSRVSEAAAERAYWSAVNYEGIYQHLAYVDPADYDLVIAPRLVRGADRRPLGPEARTSPSPSTSTSTPGASTCPSTAPEAGRAAVGPLAPEAVPASGGRRDHDLRRHRRPPVEDYHLAERPTVVRSFARRQELPLRPTGESITVLYHGFLTHRRAGSSRRSQACRSGARSFASSSEEVARRTTWRGCGRWPNSRGARPRHRRGPGAGVGDDRAGERGRGRRFLRAAGPLAAEEIHPAQQVLRVRRRLASPSASRTFPRWPASSTSTSSGYWFRAHAGGDREGGQLHWIARRSTATSSEFARGRPDPGLGPGEGCDARALRPPRTGARGGPAGAFPTASVGFEGIMCGIAGAIAPDGVDPMVLTRMGDALEHRGPDGEGYLMGSLGEGSLCRRSREQLAAWNGKPAPVGFAHRRLTIIDPTERQRPADGDASGRFALVYNGELYNYVELREELERAGPDSSAPRRHRGRAAGVRRSGAACLERFVGMWAFAILDRERRQLCCSPATASASSRCSTRGRAAPFASRRRSRPCSAALPTPEPDEAIVAGFLLSGAPTPGHETFFEGIQRLPAAHLLEVALDDPAARSRSATGSLRRGDGGAGRRGRGGPVRRALPRQRPHPRPQRRARSGPASAAGSTPRRSSARRRS